MAAAMGVLSVVAAAALMCGGEKPPLTEAEAGHVADGLGASLPLWITVPLNTVLPTWGRGAWTRP